MKPPEKNPSITPLTDALPVGLVVAINGADYSREAVRGQGEERQSPWLLSRFQDALLSPQRLERIDPRRSQRGCQARQRRDQSEENAHSGVHQRIEWLDVKKQALDDPRCADRAG